MPTALLPSSSFVASSFSSGPCLIRHAHWDFQHHTRQRKQPGRCAVCRVLCTPGSIVRLSVLCKPRCKTAAVFLILSWSSPPGFCMVGLLPPPGCCQIRLYVQLMAEPRPTWREGTDASGPQRPADPYTKCLICHLVQVGKSTPSASTPPLFPKLILCFCFPFSSPLLVVPPSAADFDAGQPTYTSSKSSLSK